MVLERERGTYNHWVRRDGGLPDVALFASTRGLAYFFHNVAKARLGRPHACKLAQGRDATPWLRSAEDEGFRVERSTARRFARRGWLGGRTVRRHKFGPSTRLSMPAAFSRLRESHRPGRNHFNRTACWPARGTRWYRPLLTADERR